MTSYKFKLLMLAIASLNYACTTINVDHVQLQDNIEIVKGDSVVILGRKNTAEIETEGSLVSCIGGRLQRSVEHVRVIPEQQFVDNFYPWFEARTAPQHPVKLRKVLDQPQVAKRVDELGIRYFIWVEGSTERTSAKGSMTCSIGPGGGGCFGFGTWEDTSDYETTIWDVDTFEEVGRISTEAVGQSYMPAFVVPIPMLARVEGNACEGMGKQLAAFFESDGDGIKRLP
jgi:hypothetical protein